MSPETARARRSLQVALLEHRQRRRHAPRLELVPAVYRDSHEAQPLVESEAPPEALAVDDCRPRRQVVIEETPGQRIAQPTCVDALAHLRLACRKLQVSSKVTEIESRFRLTGVVEIDERAGAAIEEHLSGCVVAMTEAGLHGLRRSSFGGD